MADTKTNRSQTGREGGQSLERAERERQGLQRLYPSMGAFGSPFDLFDRLTEEMERTFDRLGRDFGASRRSLFSRGGLGSRFGQEIWSPRIEAFQKGDRFMVRAELPGLKKDDVQVELLEGALTLRGERREEQEEEREGYYHSEREYGQFHRTIPLPEGVISESAQASFRNGVLEITMQAAPPEANRGRTVEIQDASEGDQKK
ncbi:MAG TPA: Hsp20/alpha crystallin family protein [Vicinamibacterales bacterium]|nr:Hsp20/alpha crystallin family protein [Vicinamibacterales bacterium]